MISLSLLIIIMLFLLTDSPQELKLEKVHGTLIIMFYVNPSSLPLQLRFKENAKILSKNSTTQANITISRQNADFWEKTSSSLNYYNRMT